MFDLNLTKHLAVLSKISFSEEELQTMTQDMTDITALMDKVCDFDTSVKPYALDSVDYENLRNDNHAPSDTAENITSNAKNVKNNSFVVPKVV